MPQHIYRNPTQYSKNNSLQYSFAMKVISKLNLKRNFRVLDVCCGDGIITYEIAKIVDKGCVIGTDISLQMINHASISFIDTCHLRFVQMNAADNIFREQFDIVTSFNGLHWVKDQQMALNGISQALIEGGQVALLLSHKKSLYHLILDSLCSSEEWKEYFINFDNPRCFFSPEIYKEMLSKAGLSTIEFKEEEMTYTFQSREHLKDFFRAAGAHIKRIPVNRIEEFLDDFVTKFSEKINEASSTIPVSFWCLQIIASKPKVELNIQPQVSYNLQLFSKL